jgi:hypothetical protein
MSMKNSSLYYRLGLFILLVIGIYSCKKSTGIDNNIVVETPYSLYFSDTSGTLYVTTDGKTINKVVFPPDGKPSRSLVTSGDNILWAKNNLYVSNNNGLNFNLTYDSLSYAALFNSGATGSYAINGIAIDFNQSMLVNLTSQNNRVYTLSYSNLPYNYLGVTYSDQNGNIGSWTLDAAYDTNVLGGPPSIGILPVRMTSFTQLVNGYLCGVAYEPTGTITATTLTHKIRYVRNFYKTTASGGTGNNWQEVTSNPDNVTSIFQGSGGTGHPLPPTWGGGTGLKDTSFFTLGHLNNRLIAIDQKGEYGAWYSDDFGANWTKYTGLPANTPLLCISSPFEQICLVGTYASGLYVLNVNTNTWQLNNSGLTANLVVRNIACKETIYKNGTVSQYIFLATNKGIYESTDGGVDWVLTIPGNYTDLY